LWNWTTEYATKWEQGSYEAPFSLTKLVEEFDHDCPLAKPDEVSYLANPWIHKPKDIYATSPRLVLVCEAQARHPSAWGDGTALENRIVHAKVLCSNGEIMFWGGTHTEYKRRIERLFESPEFGQVENFFAGDVPRGISEAEWNEAQGERANK
jgi:hypothetical protein